MYILTLNAGSSSLKIQLIDPKKWKVLYKGHADGIGLPFCEYKSSHGCCDTPGIKKHEQALNFCIKKMLESKVIKDLSEIKAVGHRIVHGGEKYKTATKITTKISRYSTPLFIKQWKRKLISTVSRQVFMKNTA
ncbi:MAG: Acetate kinase [Candidatus Peregrinibacteria bacterium GW2011_GWA2_43_8]|nr:MAG: Acetate kinase [Candidatus Peregrinibacteria bacterium GW2011_GWA2_43_8]